MMMLLVTGTGIIFVRIFVFCLWRLIINAMSNFFCFLKLVGSCAVLRSTITSIISDTPLDEWLTQCQGCQFGSIIKAYYVVNNSIRFLKLFQTGNPALSK